MNAWSDSQLSDILHFYNGKAFQAADMGRYPVYGSNGLIAFSDAYKYENSLIIGRVGAYCGSINIEHGKFWASDNTIVSDVKEGFDLLFAYYLLRAFPLNSLAGGSAQPLLNQTILSRIIAKVPELKVQKKIAAILSAYDDLIENNKRRVVLLEKMAEEIYREWFVRMRFPGHEKVKFVKGVPEGWERKKFGEYCMLKRGYDLPDSQIEQGPYPVVASTSIKAYHNQFKAKPPVITTGRSGSLGEVLFVNADAWPLNTTLYVREFFDNSPFLIYYTLKSMKLENFNAGAGVPTLNRNHLNGMDMAVPGKELQANFEDLVSKLYSQKEHISGANHILTRTRDSLLGRLISGKLSVEDLDIHFPPSMQEQTAPEQLELDFTHA